MDENGFMAQPVEQPKDGDGETQVSHAKSQAFRYRASMVQKKCTRSAQEVLLYHIGSANKQCTQSLQGKIDRIARLDNMWHIFSDW